MRAPFPSFAPFPFFLPFPPSPLSRLTLISHRAPVLVAPNRASKNSIESPATGFIDGAYPPFVLYRRESKLLLS